MPTPTSIENQLKEASQLTGTLWAVLVEREAGKWRVLANYHLAKKLHPLLVDFLSKTEVDSWLGGAISGGQSRSVSLPESSNLNTGRLYAFPLPGAPRVVLAGASQLTAEAQRLWRLVVSGIRVEVPASDVSPSASVAISSARTPMPALPASRLRRSTRSCICRPR